MTNTTPIGVFIGVDTHKEVHAAAAISGVGAHLATTTVPASSKGYGALEAWAKTMGAVQVLARARTYRRRGEPAQPTAAAPKR